MITNSIGQQQLLAKCDTTFSQNSVVKARKILYTHQQFYQGSYRFLDTKSKTFSRLFSKTKCFSRLKVIK